ncbi:EcsC family protein [Ammoniphilus sp. CFH 90114]|uniref:EcsC family protein n=1 Tax=Ammoniphilus sp. CFH 90114 TaxID=2493665 RepID=UPI00100E5DF3|nr:EcsC family protein [Ammoniphilus sp. CFH 90114]RXT04892.1 EcsC family protein [Ammoniphilus sp. CFH 90114]
MDQYQQFIYSQIKEWEKEQTATWFFDRWSRALQKKLDSLIPEVVHEKLAKAVEGMVKSIASGVSLIPQKQEYEYAHLSFVMRDKKAQEAIEIYKKVAMVEGAGTGAGGIMLSAVDFPAFIAIKFKLLQELSNIYGYNIKDFEERMFIIKVFQLAYAGDVSRAKIYQDLKEWPQRKQQISRSTYEDVMAWRTFYAEYRESIELRKMLQVIPGLGAIVGAWANRSILDDLAVTAQQVYRLRYMQECNLM